ncbi:hypothetical protein HSB1_18330 [Halogranum salarium B-1]|uniref:Uncharacterized protein n=1 Tax=Halogranum salarium B-1 TaxID=1210908 RepID=J2ZG85_9EURY|nr:hypothetical protein HSB1_18330 [Halogranum salarium B-1]
MWFLLAGGLWVGVRRVDSPLVVVVVVYAVLRGRGRIPHRVPTASGA